MSRSLNPYIAGNPVGNSDVFVGRIDIIRHVLRIFSRKEENAIVLFGQRRIGKTSVLQYLKKMLSQNKSRGYHPVYFDLQDKADWSLDDVLKDLATTITSELGFQTHRLGNNPQHSFQHEWLPQCLRKLPNDAALVLLFDEFDVLASDKAEAAGSKFFPYLRQLIASDPEHINFVFVIGRNVDDLSSIALSLFKGIPTHRVSLLNHEDTFQLIRLSETSSPLHWSEEAMERVWQLTSGHAFFTQQLCSYAWEVAYDNGEFDSETISADIVNKVVDDVLNASRSTLEWLWDGLPPAERVVSSALAAAGRAAVSKQELENLLHESGVRIVIRELQDAPRLLQDWDLLEPVKEKFRFRVELLRRWIVDNKPLQRVQEELDRIKPVAENLFQAAQGLYHNEQLKQAETSAKEAIGLNPNHVGANQLLADLLLGQNKYEEAKDLLTTLYEYQPVAARSRLVQAWLGIASSTEHESDQIQAYEKIIEIDPNQVEAKKNYSIIWEKKGNEYLNKMLFKDAKDAYIKANKRDKLITTDQIIIKRNAECKLRMISSKKNDKKYEEALELINNLDGKVIDILFKDIHNWEKEVNKIKDLKVMTDNYQQAIKEFKSGDTKKAQELLVKVVGVDAKFEQATYYLHLTNTKKYYLNSKKTVLIAGMTAVLIVVIAYSGWQSWQIKVNIAQAISSDDLIRYEIQKTRIHAREMESLALLTVQFLAEQNLGNMKVYIDRLQHRQSYNALKTLVETAITNTKNMESKERSNWRNFINSMDQDATDKLLSSLLTKSNRLLDSDNVKSE